ncbi:MAG: hypothetical protein M3N07_05290 [Pseudomonadota bacterium]|nr:hypothetical protein [Pseudomonadota bacterium]
MADIPLAEAQVVWNYEGADDSKPPVTVIRMGGKDDPDYISSWGACNQEFIEADDGTKLLMLFQQFHQIVLLEDGISPQAVHEALLVIPEYQAALIRELLPRRYQREDD